MNSLEQILSGFAEWLGHGCSERANAWVRRLEINRPEIELFRSLPMPATAAYVAQRAELAPPDGIDRREAGREGGDAQTALVQAYRHKDWNIFTRIADAVPAAQPGFLAGMPVAIKDLMDVDGYPLTCGSGAPAADPGQDAEVVARIRRAGGVIIGTTNLHELAYGITSDNPHFGRVLNPVAPDRIPGGSSGGSAAAIAAGMAVAAVGTDTAGSVRVPAACCGVVGFKPSYDVLPRTGVVDLAPSLDHVGPMAGSVADCAALFAAMLDLRAIPAWRRASLNGVRIARLTGYFEHPLDPAVREAVDQVLLAAGKDGAACSERDIEECNAAPAIQFNIITAEATNADWERLQSSPESLGEDVRVRLEIGNFLPGHWYLKAQRLRAQLAERIDAALDDADILLCATMRAPAPAVGAATVAIGDHSFPLHTAVTQLTLPFNLAGLPALSLPWCMTAAGVPVGIQIVGRRGADWQVLAVAERLQQHAPWHAQRQAAGAIGARNARR